MSHNLAPNPCFIDLRSVWLEDPAAPVPGADCGRDIELAFIFP